MGYTYFNMKNNQKGLAVPLIIVTIALIAIVGGVYYYSQKSSNPQAKNNTNVTTAVQDDKWKTYINTKYGFELKYPENYDIPCFTDGRGDCPPKDQWSYIDIWNGNIQNEGSKSGMQIVIAEKGNPERQINRQDPQTKALYPDIEDGLTLGLKNFTERKRAYSALPEYGNPNGDGSITVRKNESTTDNQIKTISIGGTTGYSFSYTIYPYTENKRETIVYAEKNNLLYVFRYQSDDVIANKIIESFKFN